MRVMAPRVQQTTEGILHRAGGRRVDVALDRGKMDDIFAGEEVWNVDAFGENFVQHAHSGFRLDADPLHVAIFEVVEHGDAIASEDGHVPVQIFALECVRYDRFVLDAYQIIEAVGVQAADSALELPGSGVGGGEGKVPADVVLEDGRRPGREMVPHPS